MVERRWYLVRSGVLAITVGAALMLASALRAPYALGVSEPNVTICHRTNSVTTPYVTESVDESAVNDPTNSSDHLSHTGSVFDFTADPDVLYPLPRNGDQWGDIVPPFDENGDPRSDPSLTLNWPAGEAIFEAGCAQPTSTTTTSTSTTATTGPTETTTPEGTSVEVVTPTVAGEQVQRTETLAFTGSRTGPLVFAGLGLVLLGAVLVAIGRRGEPLFED